MADLSGFIAVGSSNRRDWVYDPTRNQIHILGANGQLTSWSVEGLASVRTLAVPGAPGAFDISPDGQFLIFGSTQLTADGKLTLTRLDLATGATDQLTAPKLYSSDLGVGDVAITAGGQAVFSASGPPDVGPRYIELRQFPANAASLAPAAIPGTGVITDPPSLLHSEDGRYVLVSQPYDTWRGLYLYDSAAGRFVAQQIGGAGSQGDVSSAAGLVVSLFTSSPIQGLVVSTLGVMDFNLQVVKNLGNLSYARSVLGMNFSEDGHQLFLWRGSDHLISVLDTQSWQEVGSLAVEHFQPSNSTGGALGHMATSGDGRMLVLDEAAGLELIDLSARLHLTVTGGAGGDRLFGAVGADSLSGGLGGDTLAGGRGQDSLSGGADADLFQFAAGDSGLTLATADLVTDWQVADHLSFDRAAGSALNYVELSAGSFTDALALANQRIAAGVDYVAVAVGSDVVVFADSRGDDGGADDAVVLRGRSLADVDAGNLVGARLAGTAALTLPAAPAPALPHGLTGWIAGNMDAAHIGELGQAVVWEARDDFIGAAGGGTDLKMWGDFIYDANDNLAGGVARSIEFEVHGLTVNLGLNSTPVGQLSAWLLADATQTAFTTLLAGADSLTGAFAQSGDLIRGFDGDDVLAGGGGNDTLLGGLGDDAIYALAPNVPVYLGFDAQIRATYLRGEEGNDYIVGGTGFDDINGNMGGDTCAGGPGDDWVVGGKDNDLLFGDSGADIVYGNLGDDTCVGGQGADLARGGQGNDLLWGEAGDDWLSGDRGDDTLVGGAGADVFHTFVDAGIDRVLDFNWIDGDRVQLDPGTGYEVLQIGADVVVRMASAQIVLVGVQLSSLPSGWLFGA